MTNKGKKIACVALASALCLGAGFSAVLPPLTASADGVSYNTPSFDSSSPLYLGQFGTISARIYEEYVNSANVTLSTSLPLFSTDEITSQTDTDFALDGDLIPSSVRTLYNEDTSLRLYFLPNSSYVPSTLDEWTSLTLNLRNLVFEKDAFRALCDSTFISMPYGLNYSADLHVEYLTYDGSYSSYNKTLNNFIYATEDLVTASTSKSLSTLLGAPGNFWVQPAYIELDDGEFADYLYVIRELSIHIYPTYDNPSAVNAPTASCGMFVPSTEYTWLDYLDYQDMYERYTIDQYTGDIIPPPADILFSPVEAFFATELFEGFTLGNLLAIALGCLLFGLFLKIFAGG